MAVRLSLFLTSLLFIHLSAVSPALGNQLSNSPDLFPEFTVQPQTGHSATITALAFHPSGRFFVSAARDQQIKIWNYDTGNLIRTIKTHTRTESLAIDLKGRYIFSGGHGNGSIYVWDFMSGELYKQLHSKSTGIHALRITPQTGRLLVATGNGTIEVWSIGAGRTVQTINARQTSHVGFHVYGLAVNRAETILACNGDVNAANGQGSILLWQLADGELLEELSGHRRAVAHIAFDYSGNYLVSASSDMNIIIWNLASGKPKKTLTGHAYRSRYDTISALAVDAQGRIISADSQGEVRIWDLESGDLLRTIQASPGPVDAVALHPDEDTFVVESNNHSLTIASRNVGKYIERTLGAPLAPAAVAIDPEDRFFVSGHLDGSIKVWDSSSLAMLHNLPGHVAAITDVQISPDGKWIVSASRDKTILVRQSANGAQQHLFMGHEHQVTRLAVTNTLIISGDAGGEIRIWDMATGSIMQSMKSLDGKIVAMVVSPDGKKIFTTGPTKTISVWNVEDGSLLSCITTQHKDPIVALAMDPLGRYVVSSSFDWTLQFHDVENYSHVHTIHCEDIALSLTLTADGQQVVLGSLSGAVTVWDIPSDQAVDIQGSASSISTETYVAALYQNLRPFGVRSVAISPDGTRTIATSADGTITVWNRKTGGQISLISKGENWAAYNKDGYFTASNFGDKLLAMTKGTNSYGIGQFAFYLNRPDVLLERLDNGAMRLRRQFQKYHKKRLVDAGLINSPAPGVVEVPTATILETKQKKDRLTITFKLESSNHELQRYNIYVNDVPLYAPFGKTVTGKELSASATLDLIPGRNVIGVSCMNAAGLESVRTKTSVDLNIEDIKGDLYFIGLGLASYQDTALKMEYGDKDVEVLRDLFQKMGDSFRHVYTSTYTNEKITERTMRDVHDQVVQADSRDTVVLFVSSHGLNALFSDESDSVLGSGAKAAPPVTTAFRFDDIARLFEDIKPRKKLLLLDTSGASANYPGPESASLKSASENRGLLPRISRAFLNTLDYPGILSLPKNRYIFNERLRRSGVMVISSCRDSEFSYESEMFHQGVFVEAFKEALATGQADKNGDRMISLVELSDYLSDRVSALSGKLQHVPISQIDNELNFSFPLTIKESLSPPVLAFTGVQILAAGLTANSITAKAEAEGTNLGTVVGVSGKDIKLAEETNIITARHGRQFGIIYSVQGAPKGKEITLTVKLHHPEFIASDAAKPYKTEMWESQVKIGNASFDGWLFEHDWELVPGAWHFEFYYGGKLVAEHIFEVVLPEPAGPPKQPETPVKEPQKVLI